MRAYLQTEIATRYDQPPTPAQPIPGTTSFAPGTPGQSLFFDDAVAAIEDALRSPTDRSVTLRSSQNAIAARPTLKNLEILIEQLITTSGFDGVVGIYMLDLQNGQGIHFALDQNQRIPVDPDVAFTASSTIKIPILVSYFIQQGNSPVPESVNQKIMNMIRKSDNLASDDVMAELDPTTGPLIVTQNLMQLGLVNTFIAGFFYPGAPLLQRFTTPANQRTDVFNDPDLNNQTTPSDMGVILEETYNSPERGGGGLVAAFSQKIGVEVCRKIISYLVADKIGGRT